MPESIEFTFEIVGGPKDGMTGSYGGEIAEGLTITDVLCGIENGKLLFEHHHYAFIDFDKFKMHATIMY